MQLQNLGRSRQNADLRPCTTSGPTTLPTFPVAGAMAPQASSTPAFALFALNLPSDENLHMTLNAGSMAQVRRQRRATTHNPLNTSSTLAFDGPDTTTVSLTARRNSTGSASSAFSWQESIFHVRRLSHATWGQRGVSPWIEDVRVGQMVSDGHPNPLRSNPVV